MHEFCISFSPSVNLYKAKVWSLAKAKGNSMRRDFIQVRTKLKLTHGYFEPSRKIIDDHLKGKNNIWHHLLESQNPIYSKLLVVLTFIYGTSLEGELHNYLIAIKMFLRKAWDKWSLVSKCILTSYHILLAAFGEFPIKLYALKLALGFQQWLAHQTTSRGRTITWLNKDLKLCTKWQLLGKHHGVYHNGNSMTSQQHQFHFMLFSLKSGIIFRLSFSSRTYSTFINQILKSPSTPP